MAFRGERGFAAAVVVLGACMSAGCARPGPPGGGPLDSTPPAVVRTTPADGATDVPPETPIEIEFSEEMGRDSVERALSMTPNVGLDVPRWRGTTLTTRVLTGGLPDSTTFVVTIGPAALDYHSVALGTPRSFLRDARGHCHSNTHLARLFQG